MRERFVSARSIGWGGDSNHRSSRRFLQVLMFAFHNCQTMTPKGKFT